MTFTTNSLTGTMTASVFLLFNMIILINARLKEPNLKKTDAMKSLKQVAQDTETVVNIISEAKQARKSLENGNQPVSETLITEELDMLSEDAQKLRNHMLNAINGSSHGGFPDEKLTDDLKNIKSDASSLYQDTKDLISDVQYNRKQIKTHTDLAFDRDLRLLRNYTGQVLEEVANMTVRETDKSSARKNRRNRKYKKTDKLKDSLGIPDTLSKQFRGNDIMLSDTPNNMPLGQDLRCDEMFNDRSLRGGPFPSGALAMARNRGNNFDVSWMGCYLQACPQCTVSTQGSQCPLTNRVLDMKKWANELQEILTHGCVKPAGCTYPGTCCIAADAAIEQTIVQVTDMLRSLYETFHKKCISCYTQDSLGTWSAWSEWGSCDATCGRGTRSRFRRCSSGQDCAGMSVDTQPCFGLPDCCVEGTWSSWESWAACSVTCGRGQTRRMRRCSRPATNGCVKPCVGPSDDIKVCEVATSCCVDGNWGTWSRWSMCSSTCGDGRRTRTRTCSNPPPSSCGRACPGDMQQIESCSGSGSSVNGNWGSWLAWSACSATCGTGFRSRRRACNNPSPGPCGRPCVGSDSQTDSCDSGQSCCVDGNWTPWSRWSSCTSTCSDGRRTRTRTCSNLPPSICGRECQGDRQQMESCSNSDSSVNGNWGSWLAWSACSATCGTGIRNRRRACNNPSPGPCGRPCVGSDSQTDSCDSGQSCCVDGNWGMWQAWSACSATCDIGSRQRYRSCDNPSPNYCGAKCRGEELEMTTCMSGIPCRRCEVKEWTSWGSWSGCSATCGNAARRRSRSCAVVQPGTDCGSECAGRSQEEMQCVGLPQCSTDGNWGSWESWSQCSVTCGRGVSERRRRCNNPPPSENGRPCPGQESERQSCENSKCLVCVHGNWGSWQPWSPCSVTCDQGIRERRRSCDSPSPNECGEKCLGSDFEKSTCDTGRDCCINGNWGSWQPWGLCSVTCDRGTRERRRSCNSPSPNECGEKCLGREFETNACDTGRDCCIDGNWGSWQSWSSCSVTCGRGTIERRRSCDSPSANECGRACFGREFETDVCETGSECAERCVNGNWGSWSSWSACPVSCGEAVLERRRLCNNPPPNVCGLTCVGPMEDIKLQSCGPPEIVGQWTQWNSWSECSVSCGIGSRLRSRTCSNPPPALCGSSCPGQTDERVTCRGTGLCGCEVKEWASWEPWSGCSATCGFAIRSRLRACVVVQAGNDCGSGCAGNAREDVQCAGLPGCPTLNQWSAWSSCSVTCRGRGFRERFITTTIIVRRGDVAVETNETRRETDVCEVTQPECPIWGQWSPCSATCRGRGQRERVVSTSSGDIGTGDVTVESNATRKEVEWCEVQEPECPSWGEWSPCSVTCRGQGFRERIISTSSGIVGTGTSNVETDAVRKEFESCSVTEPECLYGDASWAQWDSWCPCDCRQGIRTRRRDCEKPSLLGESGQKVPIASCSGEAREEEGCDTRLQCPECILDCRGRQPGLYPSCMDCSIYISCLENGLSLSTTCTPDKTEWDAFVKSCVPAPSPSCTLQDCVKDCQGKMDGTYHSCNGCNYFVECRSGQIIQMLCPEPQMQWNQHTRKCQLERSPTCKTSLVTTLSTIPGGGFQRDEGTIPNCKNHCRGTKEGKYASCKGCEYFVICTKNKKLEQKLCPGGRQWDDQKKACRAKSSTCSTKK